MTSQTTASQPTFQIEQLLQPSAFPHPVTRITVIETHISWIILTGEFAYKIKKPVQFDFVDYSNLELRRRNCENEVSLNSRYCEGIYLDVVPVITQNGHYFVLDAKTELASEPIEYAVRMKEFDQQSILANLLKSTNDHSMTVTPYQLDQFARTVAEFHLQEPPVQIHDVDEEIGKLHAEVRDNFTLLRRSLGQTPQSELLERIAEWSEHSFDRLEPAIRSRIEQGFIKKCHGDMHLNNIIYFDNRLMPFDGIEFNEHLQKIDTLNEIAFTYMDLLAHGHSRHANSFLNAYLEETNSHGDLELFRFFAIYRAMVRAKVAWINCQVKSSTTGHASSWLKADSPDSDPDHQPAHPWDHYLDFADATMQTPTPDLTITFGFSGSGKSTRAHQDVESRGAICLRSDVERSRMKKQDLSDSLYSKQTTDRLYHQLISRAAQILEAGFPVIIDATFLDQEHRRLARQLADDRNLDFRILACDAGFGELCTRIRQRTGDPSEATIAVLQKQIEQYDPLSEDEQRFTVKPLE